jgi:hypothetical protein
MTGVGRRISDASTSDGTSSPGSSPRTKATAATMAIGGESGLSVLSVSVSRVTSTGDSVVPSQQAAAGRLSLKVSDLDGLSQRSLHGRATRKRSSDSGVVRSVPPPARDRAAPAGPLPAPPTLYPEARGSEPNLQVEDRRTPGNRILRGVLGVVGALALGAGGVVVGAYLGGLVSTPTVFGIPAGAAVGAVIGGVVGVVTGWKAGTALADYCFVQPQAKRLDDAITELTISRGGLTEQESRTLGALTDKEWRKLLHVPSSKLIPFKDQVKGHERRQKIRQALVGHAAASGARDPRTSGPDLRSARKLKETLIEAANTSEQALDEAIAEDRLETICGRLGVEKENPPEDAVREVREKASTPDLVVEDQWISAFLVSRLASQAAAGNDLAAHRRAAYAVVAHQARYAPRDQFLSATAPGGASLTRILDRYRGDHLEGVRRSVAAGGVASPRAGLPWTETLTRRTIANLDTTMRAIVGAEGQQRAAAQRVPPGLRALLNEMARAARRHARGDRAYERLALFHGLVGGNLSPGSASEPARGGQRSSRDLFRSKLDANEVLARSTFVESAKPEHAAPVAAAPYRAALRRQDHDLKLDLYAGSSSGDESSSDDDWGLSPRTPQPAPHQETLEDAQARWAPQVSAFVQALIGPSPLGSSDGLP